MKRLAIAATFILTTIGLAGAASLSKTYSYFSIGGDTLAEIEKELTIRGPKVNDTGRRHPGATRMEFTTRISYGEADRHCRVVKADVSVKAQMILPRWRGSRRSDRDVRLIWNTLADDIRRHEESHVVIAKNHARELEQKLTRLGRFGDCAAAQEKVKAVTAEVLAAHDRAQDRFDRIEMINFENRLMRLLRYRVERMEEGAPG